MHYVLITVFCCAFNGGTGPMVVHERFDAATYPTIAECREERDRIKTGDKGDRLPLFAVCEPRKDIPASPILTLPISPTGCAVTSEGAFVCPK